MIAGQSAHDVVAVRTIGRPHIIMIAVSILVLFCDGFDTQMVSFIAAPLTAEWGLPKQAMAPVFGANLTGLMVGALVITPLADIFSRRLITVACVVSFGVLSLLTLLATNITAFGTMRFVTGLALGAAMPSVIVIASEFLPAARRARLAVLLSTAFTLGFAVCGVVSSVLIAAYGWRVMLVVGGVVPLLFAPLLLFFLPESPNFLLRRGRTMDLKRLLDRFDATLLTQVPPASDQRRVRFPVASLFKDGQGFNTACIWVAYFCSGATLYFLANWLPILATSAGYTASEGALVSAWYQAGGLICSFLIGYLVDRLGPVALATTILMACFGVSMIGLASGTLVGMSAVAFFAGAFVLGGQNTLNAFTGSKLYPSDRRVTGLGWALGVLRLGGVLAGSFAAGFVISLNLTPAQNFLIIGLPETLGGLALFAIARHARAGSTDTQPAAVLKPNPVQA